MEPSTRSPRRPLISGNWKMHHHHLEALHTVEKLAFRLTKADYARVDVAVHPPFTDLRTVQTFLLSEKNADIVLGAQHCHAADKGAYTGEVSVPMLAKLDVRYVIVGHSERRQLFGETDAGVNEKARAVLKASMVPIVCCGETIAQRDAGEAEAVVATQLTECLAKLSPDDVAKLVIAYEPIWAIGTGLTASTEDAQAMCAHIRTIVAAISPEAALRVRLQYGGSVKPANAGELMSQTDIDGLLVGGASLDADDFAKIVTASYHG